MAMGKKITEMKVGDFEEFSKTITETDVYLFAGITGDFNPAHINKVYAEQTRFKRPIVHGMLIASFISNVLGMKLPGPGTIYLSQSINFTAPVYINDTITVRCEITELFADKNRVIFKTTIVNQDNVEVVNGQAVILAPK